MVPIKSSAFQQNSSLVQEYELLTLLLTLVDVGYETICFHYIV